MELSFIVVNWNSLTYLRKCIASIYAQTKCSFEVVVVDNASPTGEASVIAREFPQITLIQCTENIGFGAANNLGFQRSVGDNLLFLNPDTELLNSAGDIMIRTLSADRCAGVVGCTLLNEDRSIQTSCIQTFPTILNQLLDSDWLRVRWPNSHLWGTEPLWSKRVGAAQVEVISGACMLMRREVFEEVGGFTEAYFMYAEDLDLCYKIQKAGYSNYYLSYPTVLHYGGKSSNPERATPMKWRSIIMFCERHHGHAYAVAFRFAIACASLVRLIVLTGTRAPLGILRNRTPNSAALTKWKLILHTMLGSSGRLRPVSQPTAR
jgi:N-acetylglucosaminyl-diphospho-decaprenol L-rhamnosyltransferase